MNNFLRSLLRGFTSLGRRRIYLVAIILIPIGSALFFVSLMGEGLPLRVPVAVVDLDDSQMSRRITLDLNANELLDMRYRLDSYAEAMALTREGKIYGFFYIPVDFQKEAVGGRGPELAFYSNMTFFVPGTLSFKGLKTMAVTTSGGLARTTLVSKGVSSETAVELIQPMVMQEHPLGNPWTNYSIYLSQSFIPGVVALMVLLVTALSVCEEIKRGTSPEWLRMAGGSMTVALFTKLLPQTLLFTIVGSATQALMFGYCHFPINCPLWHMLLAMLMMVAACQALAIGICCITPNMRLSLSVASLVGILTFSIAGLSFPVANMYGGMAIFSYLLPLRYYFVIYGQQALSGFPLYYSRLWYAGMALFLLLPFLGLRRLRRHCQNPVYVP